MAVTEYAGIVINKMTLAQYKELKAANQIVASQTYVITDLDKYVDFLVDEYNKTLNLFDIDLLQKTSFSTNNNTDSSFVFSIYNDETYSNQLVWFSMGIGELQETHTFTISTSGNYLVRLGENGDVVDDKEDVWMYLEAGTYTVSCVLTRNVLNRCNLSSIMLNKGSSALSHQDYAGKVLHEKDLVNYFANNNNI